MTMASTRTTKSETRLPERPFTLKNHCQRPHTRGNMVGRIGLDSVHMRFYPEQFEISDQHLLKPCWKHKDGKDPKQRRPFYQGGRFVCSTTLKWSDGLLHVRLLQTYDDPVAPWCLLVTLSIPKQRYGHNAVVISKRELKSIIADVQRQLADIGLRCKLREAQLTRVDVFRDIQLSQPVKEYLQVTRLIPPPYCNGKRVFDRETTMVRGNNQFQWCWYGKAEEMEKHGLKSKVSPNTLRLELRLLRAAKIRKILGFGTLGKLIDHYDELPALYKRLVWGHFFKPVSPISVSRDNTFAIQRLQRLIVEETGRTDGCQSKRRKKLSALQVQSPLLAPLYNELYAALLDCPLGIPFDLDTPCDVTRTTLKSKRKSRVRTKRVTPKLKPRYTAQPADKRSKKCSIAWGRWPKRARKIERITIRTSMLAHVKQAAKTAGKQGKSPCKWIAARKWAVKRRCPA